MRTSIGFKHDNRRYRDQIENHHCCHMAHQKRTQTRKVLHHAWGKIRAHLITAAVQLGSGEKVCHKSSVTVKTYN